jgi:hypothetical protein
MTFKDLTTPRTDLRQYCRRFFERALKLNALKRV